MKGYQPKYDIKNKKLPKGDFGTPYKKDKTINKQLKLYYFGIKYIEHNEVEQLYYHKVCDKKTAKDVLKSLLDALKNQLNISEKDILKSWFHPVELCNKFAICIDDSVEGISKNKIYKIEYEIVKNDGTFYDIIDDYGIMNQFKSCRFIKINN